MQILEKLWKTENIKKYYNKYSKQYENNTAKILLLPT